MTQHKTDTYQKEAQNKAAAAAEAEQKKTEATAAADLEKAKREAEVQAAKDEEKAHKEAEKEAKKLQKEVEKLPTAIVGETVLHHAGADKTSSGTPAMVLAVQGETVDLKLFRFGEDAIRQSVLHIDHPRLKENSHMRKKYGGWSRHPLFARAGEEVEEL